MIPRLEPKVSVLDDHGILLAGVVLDRIGRHVVVVEVLVESVEGDLALHEVDDHDGQEAHRHADRVDVGQAHEGFVRSQDLSQRTMKYCCIAIVCCSVNIKQSFVQYCLLLGDIDGQSISSLSSLAEPQCVAEEYGQADKERQPGEEEVDAGVEVGRLQQHL